jgi:hypothetical protein
MVRRTLRYACPRRFRNGILSGAGRIPRALAPHQILIWWRGQRFSDLDVSETTLQVEDHIIDVSAGALPKIASGVHDLNVCSLVATSHRPWDYMVYMVRLRI